MNRRTLIAGAAAVAAFAALERPGAARVLPSARTRLLRPGSLTKLRCAVLYGAQWPQWAYPWSQWNWGGFWQPAINAAASVGANCIKFNIGGVSPDGNFSYPSDAVLKAELNQVCGYAASLGLGVYLQIAYQPGQQFLPDGSGVAAGTTAAAKICGWADSIQNILAIDACNEWDINQPSTWGVSGAGLTRAISDLTTYMTAIRAVTGKPLTISATVTGSLAPLVGLVDFFDQHYYYYNNASGVLQHTFQSELAAIRAVAGYPGNFILGETGTSSTFGAGYQQAWMSSVPSLTAASDCFGGCLWTLADTYGSGLEAGNWGMFNQNYTTARSWIAGPFGQWPAHL